jgi:hypothetical protein
MSATATSTSPSSSTPTTPRSWSGPSSSTTEW